MEDERLSSPSTDDANPSSKPSNGEYYNDYEWLMSEVHLGCLLISPALAFLTSPSLCHHQVKTQSVAVNVEEKSSRQMMSLDEDGDLVLTRCTKQSNNVQMTIQHSITSSIPSVGLQVWKAELVLADFLLHSMFSSSDFDGVVAVELGAGTGVRSPTSPMGGSLRAIRPLDGSLTYEIHLKDFVSLSLPGPLGILLARVAKTVFLSDHGKEVLKNCALNVHLNLEIFKKHSTSVFVREVDWINSWPPELKQCDPSDERFTWTPSEVEEAEGASLLLASDVIYNDDLTDALFGTLQKLMSRGSTKEKRYNFSLNDLDIVANGYSHFKSYLKDDTEYSSLENSKSPCFVGKLIDLTEIPQYVREYDRGNDVEIWQIRYISPCIQLVKPFYLH